MKIRPTSPTRSIALGGIAAASAFAVSMFAAGAAFASPAPTKLVPSVGTVPSGLTSLDHGALPVTASLPLLGSAGQAAGAAGGLGLLSALPLVSSLAHGGMPAVARQCAPRGVKKIKKELTLAQKAVGSIRSGLPVPGGLSGPSGALPNAGGVTGLLGGLPLTGLLHSVK